MADQKKSKLEDLFDKWDREGRYTFGEAYLGAIKELYAGSLVNDIVYKENPFLTMIPKDQSFSSIPMKIPTKTRQKRKKSNK